MDGGRELLHGTAIAIGGRAALIRGPSGAGKSDLALRCLAFPNSPLVSGPVELVSDDQVVIERQGGDVLVSPPDSIRGQLEVRGIGIIRVPAAASAKLVLVADLVPAGSYERLPDPGQGIDLLGVRFPLVEIAPFEVSAALKLLLALRQAGHC